MNHPKGSRKSSSTRKPKPETRKAQKSTKPGSESQLVRTSYRMLVRIAKIFQIFFEQQENDNGVRPWITREQLATKLEDGSIKTIGETITRMRDDYGIPVYYVEKRKGYGFTENVTSLPTLTCSQSESMGLCVAMLGLSLHGGTPYAAGARSIARKLTMGLRKELAVEFEALEQAVSFHCIGADAFIPPVNFEIATPAVIYHQELEIEYAKPGFRFDGVRDAETGLRRVEPLHLACIDFGWYLFAWDPSRQDIRSFALRRIRKIRMTGVTCKLRPFDVRQRLDDSFGAFTSENPEDIRLLLWDRAASMIPERLWHHSQQFEPVPDEPGKLYMTLRVSQNPRLVGWICEWLGNIAVLEPVSLREKVQQAAAKGLEDQLRIGAAWDRRNSSGILPLPPTLAEPEARG